MPPDLHFYPVSDLRKTSTRMPDPKIVHPTSEDGIDLLNHFSHWLADVLLKDFPEFRKRAPFVSSSWAQIAVAISGYGPERGDIQTPGTRSFRLFSDRLSDSCLR